MTAGDQRTAAAFATSWNNLPAGSVYTPAQVADWFEPITPGDIRGRRVLEMGCGNASLMVHVLSWSPAQLDGIDLGPGAIRRIGPGESRRIGAHQLARRASRPRELCERRI
jgi:hypothetical protein